MKKLLVIIAISALFSSCEDTLADVAIDEINKSKYEYAEKMAGNWKLEKVQYKYEEKIGDVWVKIKDTVYDDAKGYININYLEKEKHSGVFDLTFNQDSLSKEFEGHTLNIGILKAFSIQYLGANPLFNDNTFSDFIIDEVNSTKLELNRRTEAPDDYRINWYLDFSK